MTDRVFHPPTNHNVRAAAEFGELVPLCRSFQIYPDDPPQIIDQKVDDLCSKLDQFNPVSDYVLMVGDPVALVAIGAKLSRVNFQVLKFDREEGAYYSINLTR